MRAMCRAKAEVRPNECEQTEMSSLFLMNVAVLTFVFTETNRSFVRFLGLDGFDLRELLIVHHYVRLVTLVYASFRNRDTQGRARFKYNLREY